MDKQLQRETKQYIKNVKSLMFCDRKTKKTFASSFDDDVWGFIEENKITSIDDVIAEFGTVDEIAQGFLEKSDIKKISKSMQIRNVIIGSVIAAALIVGVTLTIAFADTYVFTKGDPYGIETVETIETIIIE